MVFSEAIFLFLFLPLLLGLHFIAPARARNVLLLSASLLFYAWGEHIWVLVMLGSIGFNYLLGRAIASGHDEKTSKRWLVAAVLGNLSALVALKYTNFIVENANFVLAQLDMSPIELDPVHLPIGVSFFTFQALSYIFDVYRGRAEVQKNVFDLALYISLFPQLIAGPIIRYSEVAARIRKRTTDLAQFSSGADRFLIGLAKKVVIANPLGARADAVFDLAVGDLSTPIAWFGLACYTFQIYFDFSGYSDMAIGLGRMFGFNFAENFNYPYIAKSITEFWRRWHISLSSWFRDYLYIPLGGSRRSVARTYVNLTIVFTLCGLWHGASWNFLIWGLIHGSLIVAERSLRTPALSRMPTLLGHTYALFFVSLSWVFFRSETLGDAITFLYALSGLLNTETYAQPLSFFVDKECIGILLLAAVGCTPIVPASRAFFQKRFSLKVREISHSTSFVVLLVLCLVLVAAGTYNPFIYFRF